MKPSMRKRVVEASAPAAPAVKAVEEGAPAGVGGSMKTTTEEQARAIVRAAERAVEEEKAAGGTKPSPVVRSLQRFLAHRWAAAAAVDVQVQRDGDSSSSSSSSSSS